MSVRDAFSRPRLGQPRTLVASQIVPFARLVAALATPPSIAWYHSWVCHCEFDETGAGYYLLVVQIQRRPHSQKPHLVQHFLVVVGTKIQRRECTAGVGQILLDAFLRTTPCIVRRLRE